MHRSRPTAVVECEFVVEVAKLYGGRFRVILSIPGRAGTIVHTWDQPLSWDDIQTAVLAALSDFLLLSGGQQLSVLDGLPVQDPR